MKKHWFKVRIKMQLVNSMRESICEGLKNDPIKLFYAKQTLNKLEKDHISFMSDLKKVIKEYSEYLPNLKTTEQVCDNCQSNQVVLYEDVFVCQECSSTQGFVNDSVSEVRVKPPTYDKVREPVNNFKERILNLDFFSEELVKDFERLVRKIREDPANRVTNRDFYVLCLALKNKQSPPEGLSIPSSKKSLFATITKVRDLFKKLGWTFPLPQIKEYIVREKARSYLDDFF